MDPLQYSEEFYFGQPRVPVTYLDGHDYVFGAHTKLEKILPVVAARGHKLVAVVNSPGAALIGDELERFIAGANLPVPCVAIESPGFSGQLEEGFQEALMAVLDRLHLKPVSTMERSVNLIGVSISQKHWEGSVEELRRLLSLTGISVNTVLSAGATVQELRGLLRAKYNVVVHQELAETLGPWLKSRHGMELVTSPDGAPVGLDATESWIQRVCRAVHVNPASALRAVREARQRAFASLTRFNSLTGLPKGATFAVQSEPSVTLPLVKWLHSYLGMVPVAVQTCGAENELLTSLQNYLHEIGCSEAWNAEVEKQAPDVILASGAVLSKFCTRGRQVAGVEIALPSAGYIDVVPKTILGAEGALYLLEGILNGLYHPYRWSLQ
jgi:nitrogenase molybdenum-iron protein alpha/beta subunit